MNTNALFPFVPKLAFMAEILLAELIYLYPAEKRPLFGFRYVSACIVCVLAGVLLPFQYTSILSQFLLFFVMFGVTVCAMALCFKLPVSGLLATCVAGYATEHIAFHIVKLAMAFGFLKTGWLEMFGQRVTAELCLFPPVYLLFWASIGRYSAKTEAYKYVDRRFLPLSFVVIFICIGLTRIAAFFGEANSISVSFYAIMTCLMALLVQMVLSRTVELRHENNMIRTLWEEDRRQYEISKATIDTINIKYHDLKHKLHGMNLPQSEIDEIKAAVRVYGSCIRTGNDALDVLLTENSLRCGEQGITLTYTGNGADFSFMNTMDVYSLFGNAISNAVEAVQKLDDPEKRVIDILSERKGSFLNVTVTNFFAGELKLEDGMPATSKTDEEGFHGYGMKSMRLITEKYGGSLHVSTEGDLFMLHVYLLGA